MATKRSNFVFVVIIAMVVLILWPMKLKKQELFPVFTKRINANSSPAEKPSANFLERLYQVDWEKATTSSGVNFFTPYLVKEPMTSIDETCKADKLPPIDEKLCRGEFNKNVFNGSLRSKPVGKIIHSIKFSFDIDVLEIHLNELFDVVDYFVIVESILGHRDHTKKTLLWELIKDQPRFKKFERKIIHFVLDDADLSSKLPDPGLFGYERLEEQYRWLKLKKWLTFRSLPGDTLIGFGDGDEITSRHLIHRMRHCDLQTEVFDIGIWFTYGEVNSAFKTDYPIKKLPFTFAGASFWTFKAANTASTYPSYRRGLKGGGALLGGQHLTHYNYLPFLLTKAITITDGENFPTVRQKLKQISKFSREPQKAHDEILRLLDSFMKSVSKSRFIGVDKLIKMEPIYKEVVQMPWFLKCNKNRFPSWFGKYDPRLV